MSPSVVYVMCRSESMTLRDIMRVNPFITFQKHTSRTQYIKSRDNPEPVQAQNPRRRHWQQEWRQHQLSVSLFLGEHFEIKTYSLNDYLAASMCNNNLLKFVRCSVTILVVASSTT